MPEPTLQELRAEARYRSERLALYRARVLTGGSSSPARLREYERLAASSQERLDLAVKRHAAG